MTVKLCLCDCGNMVISNKPDAVFSKGHHWAWAEGVAERALGHPHPARYLAEEWAKISAWPDLADTVLSKYANALARNQREKERNRKRGGRNRAEELMNRLETKGLTINE